MIQTILILENSDSGEILTFYYVFNRVYIYSLMQQTH